MDHQNKNRIPFIPQYSRDGKPMHYHVLMENRYEVSDHGDDVDAAITEMSHVGRTSRFEFFQALYAQPHPDAQLCIDHDAGMVWLVPYEAEYADIRRDAYKEFEAQLQRDRRMASYVKNHQITEVSGNNPKGEDDETTIFDDVAGETNIESEVIDKEDAAHFRYCYAQLSADDLQFMAGLRAVKFNCAEYARKHGLARNSVAQRYKRVLARFKALMANS